MNITGYLIRVTERKVEDANGSQKSIYNAFIVDDDDGYSGSPVKISIDRLEDALRLKQFERKTCSICCVINMWAFEGKRGCSFKFLSFSEVAGSA